MNIKNILWATDGSEDAEYALKYAKYLAGLTDATITGLHVVPTSVGSLVDSLRKNKDFQAWINGVEENTANTFERVRKEMEKSGIKFDGVMLRGVPDAKIREFAEKNGSGLIVMGKHGHGFIERFIVGKETVKVMRNSKIPVLSVKDDKKKKSVSIKHIVVPLDFYECNESALLFSMDIAAITGASVTALYALNLDMYAQEIPSGALQIVIDDSKKDLKQQVNEITAKYDKSGEKNSVKVKTEVIHGINAPISITKYAERKKSDLIVIHTHGRTGVKKLLLGSVTEKVINHSPCSVLALGPD